MKVEDVEAIEPAREQAAPRLQAGVHLAAEAREIEIADPEIRPELLAEDAADDAIAERDRFSLSTKCSASMSPAVGEGPPRPVGVRGEAEDAAVDERHARRHVEISPDGELAGHDRPRARQEPRRARLPTQMQDADEDDELDRFGGRVRGSTFHISHRIGCAMHTAHTDP